MRLRHGILQQPIQSQKPKYDDTLDNLRLLLKWTRKSCPTSAVSEGWAGPPTDWQFLQDASHPTQGSASQYSSEAMLVAITVLCSNVSRPRYFVHLRNSSVPSRGRCFYPAHAAASASGCIRTSSSGPHLLFSSKWLRLHAHRLFGECPLPPSAYRLRCIWRGTTSERRQRSFSTEGQMHDFARRGCAP